MAAAASKRKKNVRRWIGLATAVLVMTVPSLVVMTIAAAPARAWDIEDCTAGEDCPGDPGGGSVGLDNGDCFWDSCGDGSQSGDPDPSDQCTDTSCQDGQNPPEKQCVITIKPDGTLVCVVSEQLPPGEPPPPPPPDCTSTGDCPDPVTEDPIDPSTCAPVDDGTTFLFNQDNFTSGSLPVDPFPDMDPLYNDMCPPPPVPPPPPTQFGATDVAFGDSFISGEGRPPFDAAPGGPACDVSAHAWPEMVYGFKDFTDAVFSVSSNRPFENWSCTGATIADTTNEINSAIQAGSTDDNVTNNVFAGLGLDTHLVQISAGGDDLGFGPDLHCAYYVFRHSDQTHHPNGNTTCIPDPASATFQAQVNALIPRLSTLYGLPAAASNGASGPAVQAIDYPMFFPAGNTPACGWAQTHITRADQLWINADALLVDNAIRQAAANAQVGFIEMSTALQGATICDNPRGVNTVDDVGGINGHTQGAFHPNALGHQMMENSYLRQMFFTDAGASATAPADGTLVGDRAGDRVYVAAGGALFPFPNQTTLFNSSYKGQNITLEPANQVAAQVAATPADGTLLRDTSTGDIFDVSKGTLIPFGPSQFLAATNVPDSALAGYPIADASFVQVAGGDGTVYEAAGGAAIPVTNWSHVGGQQVTELITQAQLNNMAQTPADGTFVSATNPTTGAVTYYEFAGGAPIPVTNWSHVGGQPSGTIPAIDQTAIDDAGSGGVFNHIRQTPADGTVVTATDPATGAVNAYTFAGGAPIYISDWSHVGGQPVGQIAAIDQTAIDNAGGGGAFNHILPMPPDGTYLTGQGAGSAVVSSYVVAGGAPIPITDWTHLGGPDPNTPPASINPVPVDEIAIDNAGAAGVYSHLRAMPPDGTYLTAQGAGGAVVSSYSVAGGAPIPITNWTHLGGPNPTTPPAGINPVTVDENAMDNAGTGGIYSHLRAMPPDGTILAGNADKTNGIFVMAGGAPIYVSNWEDIGGARGSVNVDQTAIDDAGSGGIFNHMRAQPANGTLVQSFGTGHIFVIAGGAPLRVSSLANIGSPTQTPTFVDQVALDRAGTGGFYNHLSFTPANNTLLAGNGTNMFVVAGGAPIYVPYLEDIGGARGFVTVDEAAIDSAGSGGDWNHMSFKPADGTIFESFNTGSVYQVIGGVPTLDCSAAQTFLYVDQFALNQAGSGGFYNHLAPLPSPPPPPCPPPPPSGPGPQL